LVRGALSLGEFTFVFGLQLGSLLSLLLGLLGGFFRKFGHFLVHNHLITDGLARFSLGFLFGSPSPDLLEDEVEEDE
jgi:hypothetical protein